MDKPLILRVQLQCRKKELLVNLHGANFILVRVTKTRSSDALGVLISMTVHQDCLLTVVYKEACESVFV